MEGIVHVWHSHPSAFLIVILLVAFWLFVLAWWKSKFLKQKDSTRVYVSLLEGILRFCVVIYSRNPYIQALDNSPKHKIKPVEGAY